MIYMKITSPPSSAPRGGVVDDHPHTVEFKGSIGLSALLHGVLGLGVHAPLPSGERTT